MSSRATLRAAVVLSALLAVGCMAPVGASTTSVPKDGATECASQCAVMGLKLAAVAIMANNVGCVCQPPPGAQGQGEKAVGPAGMATLVLLEQQRQQQEQQSRTSATRR